jgi:hypothetical protein
MTREELNTFLSKEYAESNRYMDNAKETLLKAGRDGLNYTDRKYVRTACGTAYNGLLLAIDAWLAAKGVPEPGKKHRKSIGYYTDILARLDNKMLSHLKNAYDILHLSGYYDGITSVKAVESGFDAAYWIIDKIKPENPVEVPETKADRRRRMWKGMLISAAVMFMGNRYRF